MNAAASEPQRPEQPPPGTALGCKHTFPAARFGHSVHALLALQRRYRGYNAAFRSTFLTAALLLLQRAAVGCVPWLRCWLLPLEHHLGRGSAVELLL